MNLSLGEFCGTPLSVRAVERLNQNPGGMTQFSGPEVIRVVLAGVCCQEDCEHHDQEEETAFAGANRLQDSAG